MLIEDYRDTAGEFYEFDFEDTRLVTAMSLLINLGVSYRYEGLLNALKAEYADPLASSIGATIIEKIATRCGLETWRYGSWVAIRE